MFLSEEQYLHAKELFENTIEPTPLLMDLASWSIKKYGVRVIDYICDARQDGKLRMMPVLWEDKDVDLFRWCCNYNPIIQKAFALKFAQLCKKHKQHQEYTKASKVFIAYETLKEDMERHQVSA